MNETETINEAFRVFAPRPRQRTLDWAREQIQTHEGRPYDHSAYPHLGAPGGPLDAFDCRQYHAVIMQWASRLGKTFVGQVCTMKTADLDPCPMMFASADQKLATEVIARKYRMLERCPALRGQLRPVHRRKQNLIDLAACREYVAWARSVSTLADKAVRVGHANEIDKWEHASTAKEADPLELFKDRFKEFPTHKMILESTPAVKSTSRIERLRLASTNCQYFVPCPHCRRYQTLSMGNGTDPGGIIWDHKEGRSDKDLGRKTARYVCKHCEKPIYGEHRGQMMRSGVWCPEGCEVDDSIALEVSAESRKMGRDTWKGWGESPWVTGSPARDGREAGFILSSLYALSLDWGDIAAKFIEVKGSSQNLRNFVNQWLAHTWETIKHKTTWEQLGQKLIGTTKQGVCPKWSTFLTLGVDRQGDGGDRFPWVVCAWGPNRQCAVVTYGESNSLLEIEADLISKAFAHEDRGPSINIAFSLIDSGYRPDGVYEFCRDQVRKGRKVWPSKGSSVSLESDYKQAELGKNTSMPGMVLWHIDTIRSQLWMDGILHVIGRDDPGAASLYAESIGHHQDFLEQILNDAAVTELDSHNNARESWERINTGVPNDYRDCWRNTYVAMLIATRGKPIQPRIVTPQPAKPAAEKKLAGNNIFERPGGWIQPRRGV